MSNNFTVTESIAVPQVSTQLQLPTTAPSVEVLNTSTSASVTVNSAGPALLEPPTGTVLAPGDSTTVALEAAGGGTLIMSAIASGEGATVQVTMTPVTFQLGGLTVLEPGEPTGEQ